MPPRKLLELISEFSKLAGYIQKSVSFLYTNNEISEKLRKPIYHLFEKDKVPRNKSTKEAKDLYSGNYKILVKEIEGKKKKKTEIEGNANKWKDVPCS